jgi:S-layer homology domain
MYCPDNATTRGKMAVFIVRSILGDNFTFPADPYFSDVTALHPYFKYIQKMRQLGITSGCSTTLYCPDNPVTRGQTAVLVVRAKLQVVNPQDFSFNPMPYFSEVPSTHPYFAFIQKLRDLGITVGCSTTQYCPDDPNTRGQMAVFIIRGFFTP